MPVHTFSPRFLAQRRKSLLAASDNTALSERADSCLLRFAAEIFMNQHLEQGPVADALAGRDFTRLLYAGLRQPQCDPNAS
jgi:hypothetical protein